MSHSKLLTVRVPQGDLERLNEIARATGRSKSDLVSEALATYLAGQEWQVAAIEQAVGAADAGAVPISHAEVAAWLESWGTEGETVRPR
ncbi:MAG TPA: ribbon-helix-helix protein, CopG family [Chloroflexota bacterium]|nr:ribbon-helix-helix protein, CopG family [Chloroflexota bacterium]